MKELTIHHLPAEGDRPARVRVAYRPREGAQAQEREAEFQFALTVEDRKLIQWYLEEYLVFPWASHRARQAEGLMSRKGEELFQAVLGGAEAGRLFTNVANDLPNTRIVVHASDPVGVSLPWELMRDPHRAPYGDLARLAYAFVRSEPDLFFDLPEVRTDGTFNILLVISRPGGPDEDVPFQSVARPLLERCLAHEDRVRVDVLRPPTFEQLSRVLSDRPNFYHVLHFDGHGGFPQQRLPSDSAHFYADGSAQGRLLFENEDGTARPVTGEELGGLLAGKGVPAVVLNACQSGMTHPEALYPSVGNQLLKAGVGGVVAMSYSVYVQSAVRFVTRLYEALVSGEDLARAVALGREELRAQPERSSAIGPIPLQDWSVPVLLEASPVRLAKRGSQPLRLRLASPEEGQAVAGAEVDCPEPPAFGFIGRDDTVFTLERAFRRETAVLLQGMAGVGKTEVAVGFARWWARTGALQGPILFSSFERRLTLAHVCDQVGRVFGESIRAQLGRDWHLLEADQRRQVALAVLRQVSCLLVWDNFEAVAGFPTGTPSDWSEAEQRELRDFLRDLRGGQTKVLLTSRRDEPWLGAIYRRVEIGGLALREAQELAVRVLERAGMDPPQIKRLSDYNTLLEYLRGNPLAIQVVLPEMKRMKPDDLLRDLRAGEAKLEGDDKRLGRTRSLASSLTYRLDGLDPTLRQRLGLLGLFHGFANADVLAMISSQKDAPELIRGLDRDAWIGEMDKAAEVGLLRGMGHSYYTVHPALPWFFHDAMREAFADRLEWLEEAFAQTYGEFVGFLLQTFRATAALALALCRIEEGNLKHALSLTYRLGRWVEAAAILTCLGEVLDMQSRWAELEGVVQEGEAQVLDQDGQPQPDREGAWISLLWLREKLARERRDFAAQEQILLRLKEHYEQVEHEGNVAVALLQLGIINQERGALDEAAGWYRKSLEIFERLGDEPAQASTLHNLGRVAQERGQFEEAENWYRRSLAIKERLEDEHGQASTLHQLGGVAQERGQLDEAEGWYRRSLEIFERLGDEPAQASPLHQLGMVAQERGQLDEAEGWYRRSLGIKERYGNEYGKTSSLYQLGMVAEDRGNVSEAVAFYEQVEAVLIRQNDQYRLQAVRSSLQRLRPR